jgi:hypothetical protein
MSFSSVFMQNRYELQNCLYMQNSDELQKCVYAKQ